MSVVYFVRTKFLKFKDYYFITLPLAKEAEIQCMALQELKCDIQADSVRLTSTEEEKKRTLSLTAVRYVRDVIQF